MYERHTLLVVDDEADVVKSVQDLLRTEYRVLGARAAKKDSNFWPAKKRSTS